MSPDDRYQIVVKTSAFYGYESEASIILGGGISGPGGGPVRALSPIAGAGIELKYWVPFVPQPFYADQLMLSSLGGWLRSRGYWDVVRRAKPPFHFEALDLSDIVGRLNAAPAPAVRPEVASRRSDATPFSCRRHSVWISFSRRLREGDLDLSEWVHVATQGRDHYVRIVYEGELLPFRNRAALVKVTERKFKQQGSLIVAHLYQRFFIIVREPEKHFARDRPRHALQKNSAHHARDAGYRQADVRARWLALVLGGGDAKPHA